MCALWAQNFKDCREVEDMKKDFRNVFLELVALMFSFLFLALVHKTEIGFIDAWRLLRWFSKNDKS